MYMLVGCVLRPIDIEVIYRRRLHLLSLAKDVELGKYTVPTRNRTPGCRVAVHYATAAPRKLHTLKNSQQDDRNIGNRDDFRCLWAIRYNPLYM